MGKHKLNFCFVIKKKDVSLNELPLQYVAHFHVTYESLAYFSLLDNKHHCVVIENR